MRVGILGGTGAIGSAIAARLAHGGHQVVLGSRDRFRAEAVTKDMRKRWGLPTNALAPGTLSEAAQCDVLVLAVPVEAVAELSSLASDIGDKIVLSAVNALSRDSEEFVADPRGSGLAVIKDTFPHARVATAFNHIAAKPFGDPAITFSADVLVAGEPSAIRAAMQLVESISGLTAIDSGGPASASLIEAFTSVLLNVNRRSGRVHGLRLVSP